MLRILFLALALLPLRSYAGEGFAASPYYGPRPIAYFWNSIFLLYVNKPDEQVTGSAFVIERNQTERYTVLYLLTADHVVRGACADGRPCRGIRLARDLRGASWKNVDGYDRWIQVRMLRVLRESSHPDLALIQVIMDRPLNPRAMAFQMAPDCAISKGAATFLLGYPATYRRTYPYRRPIAYAGMVLKRWSSGYYLGGVRIGHNGSPSEFYGITNDSLSGDSGGPVIDGRGYVVGVADANLSRPGMGYPYQGRESATDPAWDTLAVPCQHIMQFIAKPESPTD